MKGEIGFSEKEISFHRLSRKDGPGPGKGKSERGGQIESLDEVSDGLKTRILLELFFK